ncbi:MAG: glycosyltransferase family 2 protein [Paracoccaceae bacterium]
MYDILGKIFRNYRIFDFGAASQAVDLPASPDNKEKYAFLSRHVNILTLFSIFGFVCITLSTFRLFSQREWMYPLFILLAYTVIYFLVSVKINLFPKDFDHKSHQKMVKAWAPANYPSVDVFLPTCGEKIDILANTWQGVLEMQRAYPGQVKVHCLDDAHSADVESLAEAFMFQYYARPNKGWFKKAGNLRHGFERTDGDFIAIFDADFRPRHDFLNELLPYFDKQPRLGIVQSPQYFGFSNSQNWLERGAGAVQELFYRVVQVSRQSHDGAICVGSNALYRRAALNEIGGTALIEHSEDVHTGFELRNKGWNLLYVPLVLAKGLCPSELKSFFKQQYRWCMGSMSLMTSQKFWETKLPINSRLCFATGFFYYIHTAIYAMFTPVIPLIMLFVLPEEIRAANYLLIFPSFLYMHVILPRWHKVPYGIEAASVRVVYGWAHLMALKDKIFGTAMEWQPTGVVSQKKDNSYLIFRSSVFIFNFIPAIIWVAGSLYFMATWSVLDFTPIFLLGLYYLFVVLKIVAFKLPAESAVPEDTTLELHLRVPNRVPMDNLWANSISKPEFLQPGYSMPNTAPQFVRSVAHSVSAANAPSEWVSDSSQLEFQLSTMKRTIGSSTKERHRLRLVRNGEFVSFRPKKAFVLEWHARVDLNAPEQIMDSA